MAKISIYTDGSSKGNPGNGGFGVILLSGGHRKDIAQGFRLTTNNRMELMSVIVGLEVIKSPNQEVTIYSDSKYGVDSVNKGWVFGWQKKNFKGKKNVDLWQRFLLIYPKHQVKFVWVKGHANNKYNEACDRLAFNVADESNLAIDSAYEALQKG